MNNGKICVSLCDETAERFIEKIKLAEKYADVIELRFDCLAEKELVTALRNILSNQITNKSLLITFRSPRQGGKSDLTLRQRIKFWELFFAKNKLKNVYVDFELDLHPIFNFKTSRSIASFHYFSDVPENLNYLVEINRSVTQGDVLKVAVQTDDIIDSIKIWKLMKKAVSENQPIIPIAMGEAGKWTRILALAHGAEMTYASFEEGHETAPGQITAEDLNDVYRVKELNETTDIYGIIGDPVSHSVSPFMHNTAFKTHNLNAVFIPFEVRNLDEFIRRMVKTETREIDLNLHGFAVTIPHKQAIIKHLDHLDETAQKVGAVNTVKIENGKFYGYNTDVSGFIEPLKTAYGDLKDADVAVIGAGGAARAAIYSLKNAGANVTIYARNPHKAQILADEFQTRFNQFSILHSSLSATDVLVNTTPLGMKGKFENETPLIAEHLKNVKLVYDLVYNPFETQLIKEARKADVPTIGGLAMLVAQGMWQFEIWTGIAAPMQEMSRAALNRLK